MCSKAQTEAEGRRLTMEAMGGLNECMGRGMVEGAVEEAAPDTDPTELLWKP